VPNATQLISIVDDDRSICRALRRLVRSAGFAAETFASAEDFLGSASLILTACLVLDIHLNGGMTGFELQAQLKVDGVVIPIIFITANDEISMRERVHTSGAIGYLCKPFDDHLLIAAIRGAVGEDSHGMDQGPIGKRDGHA
jgi:FixJ family two-component response regulator